MRYFYLLIPIMLLASCAGPSCWSGGIPLRPTELTTLADVRKNLGKPQNVVVYRGLAHPRTNQSVYNSQVAAGGWVEFGDFKFFEQPLEVSDETVAKVLALYSKAGSHQAWGPKTTCAGFHPDYALVWQGSNGQRVIQICYGCHEWKYLGPKGVFLSDISEEAYFGPLTKEWLPK